MGIDQTSLLVESLNALKDAVQDTLETLAFAEAQPVDAGSVTPLTLPYYITTVEVKRPYVGHIRLMIGRDLAISLIGNMLACSDPMEEEWVKDGLSELVNTMGGRILAHLVDKSDSFDLGIPQTELVERDGQRRSGVLARQIFAVNEGSLELELEFDKAQAA
jgi:CheY-specific phosphatase CheX